MPSARKIQPKRARERVSCPPRPRRLSPLPRVNSCFTRSKQGMVQSCLHQTHLFFQNPSTKFGIFTPTCTHFCCVLHANTVEFLSISEVRIIFCLCFRLYSCYNCRNHVSLHDDIISKAFQGRNGRAFLFSHAMNIVAGPKEDRQLTTGLHTVADIHCADCQKVLGWKYVRAYESSQKYKEGKFILEKSKIVKENW
ncbi:protein yippee-like At4g27745 isoform X1 [Malania oleifera]|uniref:protein yippee-like At4g27745 isoform X1 n=1 Tax=Malania oleifera TaxID=397392 RepID=UPI0025ADB385|nr:protein yippee-like At4g27745 isoform X1 [Malania oleifera]